MLYTAFYLLAPVNAYFSALKTAIDAWHIILPIAGLIAGALAGWLVVKYFIDKKLGGINNYEQSVHEKAETDAKTLKREAISEAKTVRDEALKFKQDAEKESRERRFELNKLEERLGKRDELLDKKDETLIKKQEQIDQGLKEMQKIQTDLNKKQVEIEKSGERISAEIERVAQMTREQAKTILIEAITSEARREAALLARDIENEAKENGEKKAREIISSAIQRCAADQVSEVTISAIPLPNDEMKGRLIGREGRNIRAIENATGVDLIIDDTPEVVVVSGFDPIRRQIAYITIERLITDGRIHPARIEEMVDKVKKEMDTVIKEAGEAASLDAGVFGLHPEVVKLLGRLKFRVSYGQNVLTHSLEVSYLAGMMAGELGVDVALAKRAGLLHDIGKAVDYEMEGTHIQIGADLVKKYKESANVINAIMSHHGDVDPTTIEAVLVAAADAVSSARPGARRETLENYIKRLEKLEEIANSFGGVQKCFAMQAGREIRIIVKPEVVNDSSAILLSKDIAKRIESEMEYPGQIKVSVIRETRSIEFAK